MSKVKEYFNRKAKKYNRDRNKGLLGRQISKEAEAVLEMLNVKKGERILDCGCGAGYYGLKIKARGGDYLGIDISEEMIKQARKNGLRAERCNMKNYESKQKYDKVLVSGSLEFCKSPAKALQSCVKNLKKRGSIVIVIPGLNLIGLLYFLFHSTHGFRIRLFSLKSIRQLLKKSGVKEREVRKPDSLTYVISGVKD